MDDMKTRKFKQVDVFTDTPYRGNPVAVVFGADDLSTQEMQRFAHWTNLSETTFLLAPSDTQADYRVRIFTPGIELPFAGHPTIGTCHAWLEAGGQPHIPGYVTQECGAGLVKLRKADGRLGFAAPPLIRSGDVDEIDIERVCNVLQVPRSDIVAAQWADNGPGWIAVMLKDAESVLALKPDFSAEDAYDAGVVGPYPVGVVGSTGQQQPAIEVRAFFSAGGAGVEDPVTGSLNAALAQWLLRDGHLTSPYVASQGTALGRSGHVFVEEADGEIWVSGDAITCVNGSVEL
jgi:PhzF family phenazine biosynthesis protein